MKKMISLLLAAIMLMSIMSMAVSAAVYGDTDMDGSSSGQDAALLQQYLAGWDVTVDQIAADIDSDGDVNMQDLALLQQYLAAWEVPVNITLPEIGSDIDVTKKKDRIRVSEASATIVQGGDITVSLTFRNYHNRYITEETNWVEYTCYGEDGSVVQTATKIYIGCIDTKNYKVKTFTFKVPANTAEVKLTKSNIVYWTEWA